MITALGLNNEPTPRIRCWNRDGKRLVQISEDILVINQTKGYLRFSEVRKLFLKSLNLLVNIIGKNKISSISFNTIDLFKVTKKEFNLGRYINCDGSIITKSLSEKKCPLDLYCADGFIPNDYLPRYEHSINLIARENAENVNVRMQVGFEKALEDSSQIEKSIDELEDMSYHFFENVITDDYRSLMGGKLDE
jgi:uncharacterized protein (TIGR04255 family)